MVDSLVNKYTSLDIPMEEAMEKYYWPAAYFLSREGYDVENHTDSAKAILFIRAIQYGPINMPELYHQFAHRMWNEDTQSYSGWPAISYIDDVRHDYATITGMYDFLINETNGVRFKDGRFYSVHQWINGTKNEINELRDRFQNEKKDALQLLYENVTH
jgi:hypothetical protein